MYHELTQLLTKKLMSVPFVGLKCSKISGRIADKQDRTSIVRETNW